MHRCGELHASHAKNCSSDQIQFLRIFCFATFFTLNLQIMLHSRVLLLWPNISNIQIFYYNTKLLLFLQCISLQLMKKWYAS